MKKAGKIKALLLIIILIILGFLAYMGLFNIPKVSEREIGPFEFVYEDFTGDYAETGPIFEEIYQDLLADGIESTVGLGVYYDDPAITPKAERRSRVGSVVTKEEAELADKRGNLHREMTVTRKRSMIVEFPYRNSLSIVMGVAKAYPALEKYRLEKGYKVMPAMEVYDMKNGKIFYAMEIVEGN